MQERQRLQAEMEEKRKMTRSRMLIQEMQRGEELAARAKVEDQKVKAMKRKKQSEMSIKKQRAYIKQKEK